MRNLSKLHMELEKAGLPVISVSGDGIEYGTDPFNPVELTPEQKVIEAQVIAAHDPTDTIGMRQRAARGNFPQGFKTVSISDAGNWVVNQTVGNTTEAEALAAVDSATTLAAMKPIIKSMISTIYSIVSILSMMAQILVVYRNHVWPEMPEE